MSVMPPGSMTAEDYDQAAQEYLESLPLEHFMESTSQSIQRAITTESLEILKSYRPEVQLFNELLIQYPGPQGLKRVVPDSMVVLAEQFGPQRSNFALELESAPPFWVLEYVSPSSRDKDYVDSFNKYEQELQVRYYLSFDFDRQDLRLCRHDGERYVRLEPDITGRVAIEELDLLIGLHETWIRFWYQGQLLPLPRELKQQLEEREATIRQLRSTNEQLQSENGQLQFQNSQLQSQNEQLQAKDAQIAAMQLELLRIRVEARARELARVDILQLVTTAGSAQLDAWLIEMTPTE